VIHLYRVIPWLPDAKPGQPGHALFVAGQGAGRIDNPDRYRVIYASDAPAGACAEVFDYKASWGVGMLRGAPNLHGSVKAVATLELDDSISICDLDDSARLTQLGLRPSQVVTRSRSITKAWALRIFEEGRWGGIRWWSYFDPRWGSHGVWAMEGLSIVDVEPLSLAHTGLREASEVLNRPIV
jgi:hypothetical protein